MPSANYSNRTLLSFLLMGFPGTDHTSIYLSLPLSLMYLLSILGNSLILVIIKLDNQLREPMYLLLSMLAATDLCLSLSTSPTVLSVFWFDFRRIHVDACLLQLFFLHTLCSMESAILVAMAFDRYVAICNPLRYNTILHPVIIAKIGLAAFIRGVTLHLPLTFLLKRLPFCADEALSHGFCYHPDVMKLACADITINNKYGLVIILSTYPLDVVFILFSYLMILKAVGSKAMKAERLKALNTCVSHLCVVLLFYIPLIGLTLAHRYGQKDSTLLLVLMGGAFLVIPPALNPVVYSMKTKQIRIAIRKRFWME
ncbi:olfactory receptor 51G2-like [Pleurodeles waltl]|uniref:olfactory receptor 51G2-like n=1 Tax=Pleurodeles waltl TaxID=8319 RepID=UPI0037093BB1